MLAAIAFPTYGLHHGINVIFSKAIFAATELQTAARAGALRTVMECLTGRFGSSFVRLLFVCNMA